MKQVFLFMAYFDLDVKVNVRVFYFVKKRKEEEKRVVDVEIYLGLLSSF